MPFDRQAEYSAMLDHLIVLASDPAWKRYAWERAQALDADDSGLFSGIAADLRREMQAKSGSDSASVLAGQTLTKPD